MLLPQAPRPLHHRPLFHNCFTASENPGWLWEFVSPPKTQASGGRVPELAAPRVTTAPGTWMRGGWTDHWKSFHNRTSFPPLVLVRPILVARDRATVRSSFRKRKSADSQDRSVQAQLGLKLRTRPPPGSLRLALAFSSASPTLPPASALPTPVFSSFLEGQRFRFPWIPRKGPPGAPTFQAGPQTSHCVCVGQAP